MRVLFGLDATDYISSTDLDEFLSSEEIGFVRRIGHLAGHYEALWIISADDWPEVCGSDLGADVCWQTITSCNKQYVNQYKANQWSSMFLGCVTSISQDEASLGGQYICDPFTGSFWTFRKQNPNRLLGALRNSHAEVIVMDDPWTPRGVVEEMHDKIDDLDVLVLSMKDRVTGGLADAMGEKPWPKDPACPTPSKEANPDSTHGDLLAIRTDNFGRKTLIFGKGA